MTTTSGAVGSPVCDPIPPTLLGLEIAEEVAERLNAEEDRREEDRWG